MGAFLHFLVNSVEDHILQKRNHRNRLERNAISAIMAKMEGWQKMSKKSRFGIYGAAAGYERIEV